MHFSSAFNLLFVLITYSQEGMTAADVASINEQPEVYGTLELMASPTEDPNQGLEVSYTDQIL